MVPGLDRLKRKVWPRGWTGRARNGSLFLLGAGTKLLGGALSTASAIGLGAEIGVLGYGVYRRVRGSVIPQHAEETARAIARALDSGVEDGAEDFEGDKDAEEDAIKDTYRTISRKTRWRDRHVRMATKAMIAAKLKLGTLRLTEANELMVSKYVREWLMEQKDMRPSHAYAIYPTVVKMFFLEFGHEVKGRQIGASKLANRQRELAHTLWKPSMLSDSSECYSDK